MKKRLLASILLAGALTASFCLFACNQGDKKPTGDSGITGQNPNDPSTSDLNAELNGALTQLLSDGNVTAEIQLFVAHYKDFTLKDGKYTCAEIASVNGFTCKNIEITLEDKKVFKVTYELRTESKETPDRLITIDKDGVTKTDIPKPTDDKPMDENEWNNQAEIFADVTNYTLERVRVESGEYIATMKLDGDTYYEDVNWAANNIFDKENGKFYRYRKAVFSSEWVKTEVDEDEYSDYTETPSLMVTVAAQAVQENFSNFTFEGGIYTADELKVHFFIDFTLKDMQITVSGGKIVRAVCILVGGYDNKGDERITVDHIGSTEIEFPEEYTDQTTPSEGGATEINESKWREQFSSDSFTMVATPNGFVVEQGTFCIDGNNLEIDQKSADIEWGGHVRFIWENGAYQEYVYYENSPAGTMWMKMSPEMSSGGDTAKAIASYKEHFTLFLNEFARFTLKDGKYICDDCTMKISGPEGKTEVRCTDIEVVFNEKGELVSFKYTETGTVNGVEQTTVYEFTNIGKTVVEAPEKYNEMGA